MENSAFACPPQLSRYLHCQDALQSEWSWDSSSRKKVLSWPLLLQKLKTAPPHNCCCHPGPQILNTHRSEYKRERTGAVVAGRCFRLPATAQAPLLWRHYLAAVGVAGRKCSFSLCSKTHAIKSAFLCLSPLPGSSRFWMHLCKY